MGKLNDSLKFPTSLAGSASRTPGFYRVLDFPSGNPKTPPELLGDTQERVHASVRARIRYGGTDYSGNPYRPDALKGWNLREKGVDGATATTWVHDSTNLAPNGV